MEALPDEIWIKIFEIGIQKSILHCSDLSSLSISCKHLDKLSNDDALWSSLLTLKFPPKHEHQTLPPPPSSKKTLFKSRLKRHLKHKFVSIRLKMDRDEYRLFLLAQRFDWRRRQILATSEKFEQVCRELLDMIKDSPMHYDDTIERLYRRMVVMNEEMKELLGESIGMINKDRALGIAISGEAPFASAALFTSLPSSSSSSNSRSLADLVVYLETKMVDLVSYQQFIVSSQQQLQCRIDTLLCRQEKHAKLLPVLVSRLVSLGTCSHLTDDGTEDDDDDDDTDEDASENDDGDMDAVTMDDDDLGFAEDGSGEGNVDLLLSDDGVEVLSSDDSA